MGFCKDYDYYGPDWASSWPSGSFGGVSGIPVLDGLVGQWDANNAVDGATEWVNEEADRKLRDRNGLNPIIVQQGAKGPGVLCDNLSDAAGQTQTFQFEDMTSTPIQYPAAGTFFMAYTIFAPPVNPKINSIFFNYLSAGVGGPRHDTDDDAIRDCDRAWLDGVEVVVDQTGAAPNIETTTVGAFINSEYTVGVAGNRNAPSGDPSSAIDGLMHEILIYDRTLTDQEIVDVSSYLNKKWSA